MPKARLICPKCGTADRLGYHQKQIVVYSLVDVDDDWPELAEELSDEISCPVRLENTGPAICLECGEMFPLEQVIRKEVQTFYWETNLFDPEAGLLDVFVYVEGDHDWDSRTLFVVNDYLDTCLKDIEVCPSSGLTVGDVPGLFDRLTDALDDRWSDIEKRNACVKGEIVMEVDDG